MHGGWPGPGSLSAGCPFVEVQEAHAVAARFVVVDAIDAEDAHFYEHHGFRPLPGTMRLV
jgi:membrane carboxypeptidase/penicillin-binding protein PbpC